jgi:excisionase family DNA binding protein
VELLTTTQAAKELGISRVRVVALIAAGRLKADKMGRDWMIRRKSLAVVRVRKPGRPKAT